MLVFLRVYKLVSDFNCQEMYLSHYILFIAADSDLWRRFLMRRNWLLLFFREKNLATQQVRTAPIRPIQWASLAWEISRSMCWAGYATCRTSAAEGAQAVQIFEQGLLWARFGPAQCFYLPCYVSLCFYKILCGRIEKQGSTLLPTSESKKKQ